MAVDLKLRSSRIVTPNGIISGCLRIRSGKIAQLTEGLTDDREYSDCEVLELGDDLVVPGFVDLHVHGGGGHDVMNGADSVIGLAEFLAQQGTTSFFATTDTVAKEQMLASIRGIAAAVEAQQEGEGAEILGIHLEGPFLNVRQKGAFLPETLLDCSWEVMQELEEACGGYLRRVTIAPEIEGALDLIRALSSRGFLVSGGHTAASYEATMAGIRAGISVVTHMYNAMQGLHHRNPGAVGAYLTSGDVVCEIIGDLFHVHPAAIQLVLQSKGLDHVYMISDAIVAAGLSPGVYDFAGRQITVDERGLSTLSDGTIAGSTFFMKHAFKNLIDALGVSIENAVKLTAEVPAKVAGVFDRKGSLEPGKDADITVLGPDYQVKLCLTNGRVHYGA